MAGDVKVAVVSGQLNLDASGTADFVVSGFGTAKACIVLVTPDTIDNTSVETQSRMSIGLSDFINDYCISHQDEDNSAKVDCDAIKSDTACYIMMETDAAVVHRGTASTITDGVRLTNDTVDPIGSGSGGPFATVIMFGGADLAVDLVSAAINSSADGTVTPTVTLNDNDDKLIFFIGSDISGEDSASSGINNSFGVCHATGSDGGGWTFVQRCMGWASDHNATEGAPSAILSTEHVLDMITETGGEDWALEVTGLSASGNTLTLTTRDVGAGANMEVYLLALDLDDRKAKVGSVNAPNSGTSWTPSVSLGFTPQYVGLGMSTNNSENTIQNAGVGGISSNTGSGEETCHSWYNEYNSVTTNTNNLFRSRVIDLRNDDTTTVLHDQSHSSFNSGGWTYTINTVETSFIRKWFYWAIEEAPPAGETMVAAQGSYSLSGQAANLLWKHEMVAAQGAYAYTGQAALTSKGFRMTAAQGSYAYTGQAAILLWDHIIAVAQGSYTLDGQASNLLWGHLVAAAQGSYTLTGFAAITSRDVPMVAGQGSYSYTGYAIPTLWDHLMTAAQGSYAQTGYAVDTRVGFTMAGDQGSYALSGQAAILLWDRLMAGAQGAYTYTGYDATTLFGFRMTADQGSYALTGQAVVLIWDHILPADQGSYALTGQPAITSRGLLILTAQGAYAYTGFAADTFVTRVIVMGADQGSYTLTGYAADTTFSGGAAAGNLLIPIGRRRRRM